MKRIVVSDSSCDLYSVEGSLQIVPLTILLGETSYLDSDDLDLNGFLNTVREYKGTSSTACPNIQDWLDAYEKGDEIFVTTMTSAMSGTYNSARVAKEMCLQEHPEKKIAIFDTLSAGPEISMLVEKIQEYIAEGLSFEEIDEKGHEYLKSTRLLFTLKSLHNFAANGRVSKVLAAGFDVLNMRLIAEASEDGQIKPIFQCRGDRRALKKIIENAKANGYDGGKARISHAINQEGADDLKKMILEEWPDTDVTIHPMRALCSFYAERGGLLLGYEIKLPEE